METQSVQATQTDLKQIAVRALELTDRQDLAGREALMTPDAEFAVPGATLTGPAAATAYSRPLLAAFPDSHHDCRLVIQEGDRVVVEGICTGHHTEVLALPDGDVPPSGNPVSLPFSVVFQFDGELARSVHVYFDQLTFLGQSGCCPCRRRRDRRRAGRGGRPARAEVWTSTPVPGENARLPGVPRSAPDGAT